MQDHNGQEEEKRVQGILTFFGEPIIKTECQKNALMSGIVGGIFGGLVGFLFTSNPRKSTRIGVGTYFVITLIYACCCTYDEIKRNEQIRLLKEAMHSVNTNNISKDIKSDDATIEFKGV